jgi:hypothetical protein
VRLYASGRPGPRPPAADAARRLFFLDKGLLSKSALARSDARFGERGVCHETTRIRTFAGITTLLCCIAFVNDAGAQSMKKGTLSGTVMSGYVTLAATSSAMVFTTPASGFFILTQACPTFGMGQARLVGNTVGDLPTPVPSVSNCVEFVPGLALPANEVLTCHNLTGSGGIPCAVTGVLSTK